MDAKGYVPLRSVRKGASAALKKFRRAQWLNGKRNRARHGRKKGSRAWGKVAWVTTISRLLRPDVRFTRLDHRIRLAPGGTQRGESCWTRVDHLLGAGCLHAVAPRADLRRTRSDVSSRRWRSSLSILLTWSHRWIYRGLGGLVAGGIHRPDRSARRNHLCEQ